MYFVTEGITLGMVVIRQRPKENEALRKQLELLGESVS